MVNLLRRCPACGHGFAYREGVRFCAACATPLGRVCAACSHEGLADDRYCAFCGDARPEPLEGALVPIEVASRTPYADTELAQLVAEAVQRAAAGSRQEFNEIKPHLDQADLDRLFLVRLDPAEQRPCA